MSLVPRSPRGKTPLRTAPPSLETANQDQIEDLVRRNKILEFTNSKLGAELQQEKDRAKQAILDMQESWALEKSEWRQGCDVLQSCHRVVQLRNTLDLYKERQNLLELQDGQRIEKIKILQRDYRITTFQAREGELEDRIAELEEEREELVREYEGELRRLTAKNAEFIARIKARENERAAGEQEREGLEEEVAQLREELANLQSSFNSMESKATRAELQLEGERTKMTDLERATDEAKRTVVDLRRQLEKWQNLETKGGTEAEKERKKRTALEVQVGELKEQLEEAKGDKDSQVEKIRKRYQKAQEALEEAQAEAENYQVESERSQKELNKAQKRIAKLESQQELEEDTSALKEELADKEKELSKALKQLDKLRKQLEDEREKQHEAEETRIASIHDDEEEQATPKAKQKPTKAAPKSRKAVATENAEAGPSNQRKPRSRKETAPPSVASVSDDEQPKKEKTRKGEGKATAAAEESEVEVEEQPVKKRGAKRKAEAARDSDVELVEEPTPAPNRTKSSGARKKAGKKDEAEDLGRNGKGRDKSEQGSRAPTEEVEEEAPRKKKRKINVFPPVPGSSTFNFGGLGTDTGGLDIPTVLSPVKTTNIPHRSLAGSVAGSMNRMLTTSFAPGRR